MAHRCEQCFGRLDRPGLFGCDDGHPAPTLAQRIVRAIEENVNDRRGIKWAGLDRDVAEELRDTLAVLVERELERK